MLISLVNVLALRECCIRYRDADALVALVALVGDVTGTSV